MARALALAATATMALAACAPLPPHEAASPGFAVPASWSVSEEAAAADASPLAQWWLRFDDPLLARLIGRALLANASVRTAQAALQQAWALRDASAAALWPTLGSAASAQRSTTGSNDGVNSFRAGLDASWALDVFGANRRALDASDATARASGATLGDVQVAIAAEVALTYIGLRSAQVRMAIAEDNLGSQLETLQITQWRMQAGLVTALDAEQARAAAEQTRAAVPTLQTSIDQAGHALAVLTGQPPAALSLVLAAPGPVPVAPNQLTLAIPAETLRQRADIRVAEHQVTAAWARVAQAEAARLPNFSLGGTLGVAALTLGSLTHGASIVSTLLAGVSWPVFDGGSALAQVRVQQAALDQARIAYQAAVLTALQEVEDALAALRGDRLRLSSLRSAADAATRAAQLARLRYGSGLVDFQAVLETQRTQLATQVSVASAAADLSADHVRLYQALGGDWRADGGTRPSAPSPVPLVDTDEKITRTSIP